MEVLGRDKEMQRIDGIMQRDESSFLVVYGRRRIGKTYLVREYLAQQTVFYFTGTYEAEMSVQLEKFHHTYLRYTKGQKETRIPDNWHQAFEYLANYLERFANRKSKVVVFLDEMPWMNTPRSGFLSALEYFWNQYGSRMKNLLLIACGSATTWMKRELIEARGGLHNRVTDQIHLKAFNLKETELYCKNKKLAFSRYQILQLYMVFGGVPFYLNALQRGKSVMQNINDICFEKEGLLYAEYTYLFASLFKKPDKHIELVEVLASHPQGLTRVDLVKYSHVPEGGTLNRVLEDLELSGFVSRHLPFQKRKKDTIYKLADNYSLFYQKFIKNSKQGSNTWFTLMETPAYKAWSGYAFENICLLHIDKIKAALGIAGVYTETSAWKFRGNEDLPGAQIDLLIDRRDQVINLCEAKFTDKEFVCTKEYAQTLRRRRTIFSQVNKSKKVPVVTLITTYPAMRNAHYMDEIHAEVTMDALFE